MPQAPIRPRPLLASIVARPWLLVFLPANAAAAGFSVALPLLILFTLHGGILEVALASALYNAAIVPASLFWGVLCDRLGVRAPLLLLNYAAFIVVFLVLAAAPTLVTLLVCYTVYGLVAPSSAAASNLLVLERFPAHERATAYASFSELSVLGSVIGTFIGFLWVLRFPGSLGLLGILYISAASAAASAIGVVLFIRDPETRRQRWHLSLHPESLVARLHLRFPYFPHMPQRGSLRRARSWLRQEATHEVPLMLTAGLLYSFGSAMFNTSYTPYMASVFLPASAIFLVGLSNNAGQAMVLPFTGRICEGGRSETVVQTASWARAGSYGTVFGLALLPLALFSTGGELGINALAYGIIGVTYAFYSTSSSLLLFRSLEGRNAGSLLGTSSAFGGVAAVLGAATSGAVSGSLGFAATFLVSAMLIAVAVPAWRYALRAYARRVPSSPPGSSGAALTPAPAPAPVPAPAPAPRDRPPSPLAGPNRYGLAGPPDGTIASSSRTPAATEPSEGRPQRG